MSKSEVMGSTDSAYDIIEDSEIQIDVESTYFVNSSQIAGISDLKEFKQKYPNGTEYYRVVVSGYLKSSGDENSGTGTMFPEIIIEDLSGQELESFGQYMLDFTKSQPEINVQESIPSPYDGREQEDSFRDD